VNDLPDANYATLRFFMGHLHTCGPPSTCGDSALTAPAGRIAQYASHNSMSASNLSIVFGPTLFGDVQDATLNGGGIMADTALQNKVRHAHTTSREGVLTSASQAIETILEHYTDIFVDEVEGGE
jgi:hypothetical protein